MWCREHDLLRIVGGASALNVAEAFLGALCQAAGKIESMAAVYADDSFRATAEGDRAPVQLDCAGQIAFGLLTPCQPAGRVSRNVIAMYLARQGKRIRRPPFGGRAIEQEERRVGQHERQLRAPFDLLRIQALERALDLEFLL